MSDSHVRNTLNLISQRRHITSHVTLDGKNLTIPDVLEVSLNPKLKIGLAESALEEVSANEVYLKKKLENGLVVYGINTGFGGSAEVRSWKLEDVQRALIRHVNAGMGRMFPSEKVRAAMVTRANCLAKGYSGVRPIVPQTLVNMINSDISPQVPLRGSVSASGDLMPLGYIAAALRDIEWYDLLFFSEEKSREIAESCSDEEQVAIREHLGVRMSNLYKAACSGSIDASKHMGKGTKKMYNFIRKDLQIPFYCGQNGIDNWLRKILETIQNRKIETVLEEVFRPALHNQKTERDHKEHISHMG
ncbi:hypothetical protein FSP39_000276 [Pinctada imbricata]|uniref:Phenylalanine ammonia-lyase n=1 Tax=Pinctada imbricata TaxID=66713 RepID=A0AA88YNP4_PINIB|nr:hypothetical protein FSP39_000276 [Pinctada imbricata]